MDHSRMIAAAHDLAPMGKDGAPPTVRDLVWALTEEAARVLACGPKPGPRGYPGKSTMPEPRVEPWEVFGVLREMVTDGVEQAGTRTRFTPDAAQISRADEMHRLWVRHAFPKLGDRRRLLLAIWMAAAGAKGGAITKATGLSAARRSTAKMIGCRDVATALGMR